MKMNIFDKLSSNINMGSSVDRLIKMSQEEKIVKYKEKNSYYKSATLFDFVNEFCFKGWKHRGECLDVSDFLKELKYNEIKYNAHTDRESLLELIELIRNIVTA